MSLGIALEFSKVSSLLDLLHKITIDLTFEVFLAVIRDLWRLGFPLLSLADAAHTNFGSSESS